MSRTQRSETAPSLQTILTKVATRGELQAVSEKVDKVDTKLAKTRDDLQALSNKVDKIDLKMGNLEDRFKETVDRFDGRFARIEDSIVELTRTVSRLDERVLHSAPRTWILSGVVSVLIAILGAGCWLAKPYVTTLMRMAAASGM
ncbi:hypothetical protein [Luteibacter aegosomatissinici]|uniref:hypothetical protein n=1 Tax=Luteibacter aegosomatissinici TaxID=2911539 RepID=UPI001FF99FCA|nr:hypothetical protein [Luteibacter aegosomatissinici]UPG93720.1 hypothetical protein L2Y97_18035 [Luteibacter aegosomatissinici]